MAFGSTARLKTWGPVVLACALGCATGTQNEGLGSLGIDTGGTDAGGSSPDASGSGGMETTAGSPAGGMGGAGATSVGGTPTAGSFTTGGTGGTPGTAGTFVTGGTPSGGTPSGGGGAGGASGGKGGGGAGGTAAGAGGKGGSGGSGGSPATGCAANPIPAKTAWMASAAREAGPCPGMPNPDYCGPAVRAVDGLTAPENMTRYTTGAAGNNTDWLQIDFGKTVTVSKVVLNSASANDATQGYAVRMSAAAGTIAASAPITSGTGQGVTTTITFPATTGQFLRISLTGPTTGWWSIQGSTLPASRGGERTRTHPEIMTLSKTTPLATWGSVILACALGCATESQGGLGLGANIGGSGDTAGTGGTPETAGTGGGTSNPTAGMSAGGTPTGGSPAGGSPAAGSPSGGTFATGGTFVTGGTFATGGTFSVGGGGAAAGGTGGKGGAGGASAGAGGKGGAGGAAAGAGGKGGSGGTPGGGNCESVKFTLPLTAASDKGNAQYPPSEAIDGKATTRWASEQLMDDEWLQLDLGAQVMVNRVVITWQNAYATSYKLQIADAAAGPFTDIYSNAAGDGDTDDIAAPTLTAKAGRYLRMQGLTRKTQYGYSIWEIEVYGDTDAACK